MKNIATNALGLAWLDAWDIGTLSIWASALQWVYYRPVNTKFASFVGTFSCLRSFSLFTWQWFSFISCFTVCWICSGSHRFFCRTSDHLTSVWFPCAILQARMSTLTRSYKAAFFAKLWWVLHQITLINTLGLIEETVFLYNFNCCFSLHKTTMNLCDSVPITTIWSLKG